MSTRINRRTLLIAVPLSLLAHATARAQSTASDASGLSMLAVAVSVAGPVLLLAAGVSLSVVAIESTAKGTVWVLERASDGARMTVSFAAQVLAGAALSVGAAVLVTVIASGYVLSAAGAAIAFIPNEIGASLLYNERVTR
jgi:hypothetical protein